MNWVYILSLLLFALLKSGAAKDPPNIVFIVADDLVSRLGP